MDFLVAGPPPTVFEWAGLLVIVLGGGGIGVGLLALGCYLLYKAFFGDD